MAPWQGPRHKSWASNTVLSGIMFALLVILTVWSDSRGDPPDYLVGLLGVASTTFFGAIAGDKAQRDKEIAKTAHRAEAKADALVDAVEHEMPGTARRASRRAEHAEAEAEEEGNK